MQPLLVSGLPMSSKSRLVWRCRRGTKELDIIFGRFLERGYDQLDDAGRALFERLLDCEDDQLQDWFVVGTRPEDRDLARLIDRIANTR